MSDPLGLIGASNNPLRGLGQGLEQRLPAGGIAPDVSGPSFKDVLMQNLQKVNELQQDASKAVEDLTTGRRDDVPNVLAATAQADLAFKALQAVRNKVMEAYDEIKQIRV